MLPLFIGEGGNVSVQDMGRLTLALDLFRKIDFLGLNPKQAANFLREHALEARQNYGFQLLSSAQRKTAEKLKDEIPDTIYRLRNYLGAVCDE